MTNLAGSLPLTKRYAILVAERGRSRFFGQDLQKRDQVSLFFRHEIQRFDHRSRMIRVSHAVGTASPEEILRVVDFATSYS